MEDILWPLTEHDGDGRGLTPEFSWDWALQDPNGHADAISFSLVDARTDEIVRPLTAGDLIDASQLSDGIFSIIAHVDDSLQAESVVFKLNGKKLRTESIEPYALFSDNPYSGNIFGKELFEAGDYELEATAFSKNGGRGHKLAKAELPFSIVPDPTNSPPLAVADDYAVEEDGKLKEPAPGVLENDQDADGDSLKVVEVNGSKHKVGKTITLDSGARLKLNADGSFKYNPNGKFDHLDDGDVAFDSFDYVVSDGRGGRSTATSTITVQGVTDPPDIRFFLVDADADVILRELKSGDNIDPAEFDGKTFSIIAKVDRELRADSVVFDLNGEKVKTENFIPYALFGDNLRGDIAGRSLFEPGNYQLEASAFSRNHGRGRELAEATLDFTIGVSALSVAVTAVQDDTGLPGDGLTSDDTLVIVGTATANTTVEVFIDGNSIGETATDASGDWIFDHSATPLGEGAFEIKAVARDGSGNSSESDPFDLTVDQSAPAVAVTTIEDDSGTPGDGVTSDDTLVISGTATPDSSIEVFIDGGSIGTTTSDGSGTWSIDHSATALGEGAFAITAQAMDLAGNSRTSDPFNLTVDQAAPSAPAFDLAPASDSGDPGDGITNISPVTLEGTTDPNTTVRLEPLGLETTSDGSGAFSFADVPLSEGANAFTVLAIDAAGNSSSSQKSILLDTTVLEVAVTAIDEDSGAAGDGVTSDDTLVISGTATPDSDIEVFIDGNSIGNTASDGDGNWTLDHSGTSLGEGAFVITAEVSRSGESATSAAFDVAIDQTAPVVAVTAIQDDTGADSTDGITNDDTLVIVGTAEPGVSVEIFIDGALIGTTSADGSGDWSFDHSGTALGEGSFDITAKATDLAGNMTESAIFEATIDLTGPAAPTLALPALFDSGVLGDLITNISPVTLTGTSDPNTAITISPLGLATTTDGAGNFEFAGVVLSEGDNALTVTATDELGNESVSQFTVVLDTLAPIISLTSPDEAVPLDASSRLQGSVDGTGSANASLSYQFDPLAVTPGVEMPVPFNLLDGSFDVPIDISGLGLGEHEFDVLAFDVAGNLAVSVLFVDLNEIPPLTLGLVSPVARSGEVGVTFHPEISFSRAVDPATLTANSFFATDPAGNVIPANIIKKLDGTGAFLFFDDPLPGASQITVHVVGDLIEGAADAALLDGDGDGVPGGEFTYSFTTVNQELIPGTTLVGRAVDPGPDLIPGTADDVDPGADGQFGTEDDVFLLPIAGARVFILGRESEVVLTDANGFFELTNVPSGNVKVAIDGRTASNPPAGKFFPEMVMDMTVRPGIENTIPGGSGTPEQQAENQGKQEIYLPRLDESMLVPVSNSDETLVLANAVNAPELTEEQRNNLNLLVQPGSLIGPDGLPLANPEIGISTVPAVLVSDMLPQGLLQHTFDITIQAPDTAIFAQPLQATFPNVFDAPPGTQLNFLSFDHTTGRLVIEGTATVSADGLSVTTDPDTGITQPGWHGLTPAGSPSMGPDETDDPKDNNLTREEYEKVAKKAADGIVSVLAQLTQIGAIVKAYKSGAENTAKLVDETQNTLDSLNNNDPGAAFRAASDAAIALKNIAKSGFDVVKAAGEALTVSKAKALLELAKQTIETTLVAAKIQEAKNPPDCPNPSLQGYINTLESLDFLANQIQNALNALDGAVNGVKNKIIFGVGCGIMQSLDAVINRIFPAPPGAATAFAAAEGPGFATLTDDPDTTPIQDLMTPEEVAEFQTGLADAVGIFQEVSDAFAAIDILQTELEILEVEDAYEAAAAASGQLYVSAHGNPADAYYRLTSEDGFELRGQTGANGELDVFLPAETELTLQIYDSRTNAVGETTFTTASSGQTTEIPIPFYFNIDNPADFPDGDGDLLADIAETIVGTDSSLADTDGDGPSDFIEVKNGLNPLDGVPAATGILASLPLSGEALELVIQGASDTAEGDTAFITTGSFGLSVVDVTDPFIPLVLAELDLPGTNSDVAVDSQLGIALLAGGSGGLHFVDVSDPANPTLLTTAAIEPSQVKIFDGFAFANDGASLKSFDIATEQERQSLTFGLGLSDIVGMAREGNFLYVTDETGTLRVVELDGETMIERGSVAVPNGFTRPFVGDGLVFLPVDLDGGFSTVDVSDPDNPTLIDSGDSDSIANRDIALNGSGLGIMVGSLTVNVDEASLDVVDVSDPTNTAGFLTRFALPAAAQGVAIGGGIAFVADGTAGLQVVNYLPFDSQGVAPGLTVTGLPDDIDPVADGIQVSEGQRVTLQATVSDDVQVRNVELLINGVVARNDVSFPFELFADLPTIAENGDSDAVVLQLRVIDTGGNSTLSEEIAVQLVPDVTPPQLIAQNIAQDQEVGGSFRTFVFTFSEAIDEASASDQSFKLLDPLGVEVHPTSIQVSFDKTEVRLSYAPLAQGQHSFELDAAAILDLAGNALGVGLLTTDFTVTDFTVFFTGGGDGVSWFDPDNWSTGEVPDETDDVLIDIPGDATITFLGGVDEVVVSRLVLQETLDIQAGRLRVTNDAELNSVLLTAGQLALDGAASIVDLTVGNGTLDGAGTTTVTNSLVWDGNGQMTGTGTTHVAEAATASLGENGFDLDLGRTLEIAGEAQLLSGSFLQFGTFDATTGNETGILSILATGRFEFVDGAGTLLNLGAPPHQIINAGTIVKSGAADSFLSGVPLTDTGSIEVQEGLLSIDGGGTSTGAFSVAAAATLQFTTRDFALNAGASLSGDGDISAQGALVTVNSDQALATSGTVKADDNGGFEINVALSIANLEINSSSTLLGITGSGDVTVTNDLNWVSGIMSGSGKTTLAAAATASLGNAATGTQEILSLAREFEVGGSAQLESAIMVFGSVNAAFDATLTILSTGIFEMVGADADMSDGSLSQVLTIANNGTFNKSGAGESLIPAEIFFTHSGAINVDEGILRILGFIDDGGTVNETNGGQLLLV